MNNYFSHKDLIVEIAKVKSFSKASQNLYISQPSLSIIVKKLEDEIGMPLFDRSYKPIRLTPAGEKYVECAQSIDLIESNFSQYLSDTNNLLTGVLKIGGSQLISTFVFPKYICDFSKQFPNIKLKLYDANSSALFEMLNNGDVDLIIDNKEPDHELFESIPISSEHLVLGIPKSYKLSNKLHRYKIEAAEIFNSVSYDSSNTGDLEDIFRYLLDVPFVTLKKGNETRARQDSIFKSINFHPQVKLEVDRLSTLHNYLLEGMGVAIISDTLLKHVSVLSTDECPVEYYRIPSSYATRTVYISYKQNKYFSLPMKSFCETFKAYI